MVPKASVWQKRLVDNLGTGLLALILSLVVWVNATYENDRPREDFFPIPIPIETLNLAPGLTVTKPPVSQVQVRIKAFASSWSSLTTNSFRATVDWRGLAEGVHLAPVKITCSDRTVTILRVQPEAVYVGLERLIKEAVEVTVPFQDKDDLPLGYSADPAEVEPRFVTVEGPASAVRRVVAIEAPISLRGQRVAIEQDVEPRPMDADGKVVSEVKVAPKKVKVKVDIKKKLNYREVAVRARTKGSPARGYFISSVNVDPSTVTVFGPPTTIATMPGLVSIKGEIDVTGATRMFSERRDLDLPAGVSVLSERDESQRVLVTVEIDPVMGGTTVELPLRVRKLQSGLVVRLSVPAVDVIITGPAVLLDDLQTDLLEAYVDVGGLGIGIHQVKTRVELRTARNPRLSDLTVASISPEYIEAELRDLSILTPIPPVGWMMPDGLPTPTATLTPTVAITRTLTLTPTLALTATPRR